MSGRGLIGDSSPDVWRRQEQERSSFVCVWVPWCASSSGLVVRAS